MRLKLLNLYLYYYNYRATSINTASSTGTTSTAVETTVSQMVAAGRNLDIAVIVKEGAALLAGGWAGNITIINTYSILVTAAVVEFVIINS